MNGGLIIPDKDTAKALMEICEIEGWNKTEYVGQLKKLLNSIGSEKPERS